MGFRDYNVEQVLIIEGTKEEIEKQLLDIIQHKKIIDMQFGVTDGFMDTREYSVLLLLDKLETKKKE
jgi:hypothetical protein